MFLASIHPVQSQGRAGHNMGSEGPVHEPGLDERALIHGVCELHGRVASRHGDGGGNEDRRRVHGKKAHKRVRRVLLDAVEPAHDHGGGLGLGLVVVVRVVLVAAAAAAATGLRDGGRDDWSGIDLGELVRRQALQLMARSLSMSRHWG